MAKTGLFPNVHLMNFVNPFPLTIRKEPMKTLEFPKIDFVNTADDCDFYTAAYQRQHMAESIARFLNYDKDFKPYCPNEHDDFYWTIDSGNDWKIQFLKDQPHRLQIRYRYQNADRNPHEEALIPWLVYRLGAKFVDPKDPTKVYDDENMPALMKALCPAVIDRSEVIAGVRG